MQITTGWPQPRSTVWERDEYNRLILFKLPPQIDLTARLQLAASHTQATTASSAALPRPSSCLPALQHLPPELLDLILAHLPPVDRVCLALTCTSLCHSILIAPRLTPISWSHFTSNTYPSTTSQAFHQNTYSQSLPESYELLRRLAHGWIPKDKLRYCWKCHRIRPRDKAWWYEHGSNRLKAKKKMGWSFKTECDKPKWISMNLKERLEWLVDVWCTADWEDSSLLACDPCRARMCEEAAGRTREAGMDGYRKTMREWHADHTGVGTGVKIGHDVSDQNRQYPQRMNVVGAGSLPTDTTISTTRHCNPFATTPSMAPLTQDVWSRHPVQCPACLERELTFTWIPPRKPVVRKALKKGWSYLERFSWSVTEVVLTIVLNLASIVFRISEIIYSKTVRVFHRLRNRLWRREGNDGVGYHAGWWC